MTVSNQSIKYSYLADGLTTTFPFHCRVILAKDLTVTVDDVVVSNYTVIGLDNDSGGNIVFNTPPVANSIVFILRDLPLERETDYQTNGDFLAKTVNKDFDRLWMSFQGAAAWLSRALCYPLGGTNYDADNRRIVNMSEPINKQDAATKNYVDDKVDPVIATVEDAKNIAVESKNIAVDAKNTAVAASETAVEARDEILAIGAVSLSADNIFTGQNTFNGGVIDNTTGIGRQTSLTLTINSWDDAANMKIGSMVYVNANSFSLWPFDVKYGILKKVGSKIGASGDEPWSFYCEFQPYNSGEIYTIYREGNAFSVFNSGGTTKTNARWYSKAIGEIVTFSDFDVPPTNLPDCRYIILSVNDSYNAGVISNQHIEGTAPLIYAWGNISLSTSPMNNGAVRFINNEGRHLTPSTRDSSVNIEYCRDDAIQNITGAWNMRTMSNAEGASVMGNLSGAFREDSTSNDWASVTPAGLYLKHANQSFDASRVARTDNSTHPREIERKFYMRIL